MREMKDSGVPWIGAIPKDWQVIPLKGLGRFYGGLTGKAGDDFVVNDKDYFELFVPFTNIFNNNVVQLDKLYKVKITVGEKQTLVHKGDILFLMSSEDYEGLGKSALMNDEVEKLHLNSFCKGFTPNSDVVPSFLNYYLQGQSIREYIRSNGNGFIRINLKVSKLGTTPVLLPSLLQQQRIADFLDAKCAEIDSVLEKTKASIEDYRKLKQSVITEAVTKGVRGKRPMKDSGVEWIGEIPKEWKMSRVGLHYKIILGKMLCSEQLDESYSLEKYFCAADVHFSGVSMGGLKTMWFNPIEKTLYKVFNGDLLVVEGGAGAGGAAVASEVTEDIFIQNSIMIVRPMAHNSGTYLKYLLESLVGRGYVDFACNKATIPHFTKDKLGQVPFPLPSTAEQQEIAAYLDSKCAAIDSLIASKEALVAELETYKKSIIYEYVTGKKEVPAV